MQLLKVTIFCCLSILIAKTAYSQNPGMIHSGEINFEMRVNNYAILSEYYENDKLSPGKQQFAQQYKADKPQFGVSNFALSFNDNYSLYAHDNTAKIPDVSLIIIRNIVYSDLKKHVSISQKNIIDDQFLVSDSTRKIQWKITNETKEIAGFNCRRANAVIMDSVYVVAFYTDQIVPRSGPESFTGLPGMILGVALPHEHITWFATGVINKQVSDGDIKPPSGGKKINNNELLKILLDNQLLKMDMLTRPLFLRNYMF